MDRSQISQPVLEYIKKQNINLHGLSSQEVHHRSKQYGKNTFVETTKPHLFFQLLSRFYNPLVLILVFASSISALTGQVAEFIIIISIIILSILLDFIQEYQSEKAAEKLRRKVATHALVLRERKKQDIPLSHITIGDIVYLEIGDIVPADGKILHEKDLHIDESTLTGESLPVEKNELHDVFTGSSVVNGEAVIVVTAIGKNTQYGKIAHSLSAQKPETDFQRGIYSFGLLVAKITFILVFIIFLFNTFIKHDLLDSLLFSLALAVGLTPELLPLIVTINLVQGALRMSKKGVIVKHLPSIQNLGSMNILCTDKTGTITENAIKLERYENIYAVEDKTVLEFAYLNSFYQSNQKNPLDEAVLAHTEVHLKHFEKIDEIPFDFVRKRLSVVIKNDERLLVTKGAPLPLMEICTFVDDKGVEKKLDTETKDKLIKRFQELSLQGFRVLGVAYKKNIIDKKIFSKEDETEMTFAGFTAFFDPPRLEAKEVLKTLKNEGIPLKILTGDNELVTKKVCEELQIPIEGIVLGTDLDRCDDATCIQKILSANIFARLTPDQKQRIIILLKTQKYIVGYLGDGVNDAPSLKAADIGISVNNAVDVAKETADIILVTKSLHVLHEGVKEGRRTFANVLKYIFVGMGSNFGNMISVSIASLFLPFLPLLPIQILLNNLLYDMSQLAIPFDNTDEIFLRKPLKWDFHFIKNFILIFGPLSSFFDFITFYILLIILHASIPAFRSGWFFESILTQSIIILSLRTHIVPFFKSKPHIFLFISSLTIPLIAFLIVQSSAGSLFQFIPLQPVFFIYTFFILAGYIICVETAKKFFYNKYLS